MFLYGTIANLLKITSSVDEPGVEPETQTTWPENWNKSNHNRSSSSFPLLGLQPIENLLLLHNLSVVFGFQPLIDIKGNFIHILHFKNKIIDNYIYFSLISSFHRQYSYFSTNGLTLIKNFPAAQRSKPAIDSKCMLHLPEYSFKMTHIIIREERNNTASKISRSGHLTQGKLI